MKKMTTPRKPVKAIVLTEIISPYRIKPFNRLAQYDDITLEVLFFSETESRRQWRIPKKDIRFPYRILQGLQVGHVAQGGPMFLNPGVVNHLWRSRPDVLICGGWHHPTIWLAIGYAEITGTRFLMWSESTLKDHRSSHRFKEDFKRWIVRKANGYIVPGKAQRDYLLHLGACSDRTWIAPNAVDTDFFSYGVARGCEEKEKLKREMGFQGSVILYVGRLRDEKGIPDLLAAFESIAKETEANLILVGDGPHEHRYRQQCQEKALKNVRFEGFKDQEELPKYYAVADLFVFPTHSEPWGLVLNEAMAAGVPTICSSAAGAADDLVEHGGNGFLYPSGDVEQLAQALYCLLTSPDLRQRMGKRSRQIICDYTPKQMAQGFAEAILELPNHARPSSRIDHAESRKSTAC